MIKTPGYRLLVKPEEIKRQTASGLIIEYAENEKLEKGARTLGEVIDIGPLCWGMDQGKPEWCKIGDKIYWAMYAGKNVVDPETQQEYIILNDEDVVGVVCQ
jgi:co-chaperonin GroES (HSP10)